MKGARGHALPVNLDKEAGSAFLRRTTANFVHKDAKGNLKRKGWLIKLGVKIDLHDATRSAYELRDTWHPSELWTLSCAAAWVSRVRAAGRLFASV